jgi:hypothetical protein
MHDMPELYAKMLDLIRPGAFGWVAAQAINIAPETFSRWLTRGQAERRGYFRQFRQDVYQAAAQARLVVEIEVKRHNPLAWLRFGPGRTTEGRPAWTEASARVATKKVASDTSRPVLAEPTPTNPLDLLAAFEQAGYISILPLGKATFVAAKK